MKIAESGEPDKQTVVGAAVWGWVAVAVPTNSVAVMAIVITL